MGEDGEEQTYTYNRLYREVNRFANALKRLGVRQGGPRRPLHAAGPRGDHRHARLRPHRRHPLGGLRRAWGPRRSSAASTTPGPGWSSAPTSPSAAARRCRSSTPSTRPCATCRRSSTSSSTAAGRAPGTRPSSARQRARARLLRHPEAARHPLPAGAGGRRASAVHPLHLGHHRPPQGGGARHRRLSRGGHLPRPRLLPDPGAGHLLEHLGHRLDRGPLVHRLRAAVGRRHRALPRGGAGLPVARRHLGALRAVRGEHRVHGAHGAPHVDEPRRRGAGAATTSRACACSPAPASRSTRRPTAGRRSTSSARGTASWSTTGGRPRSPAPCWGRCRPSRRARAGWASRCPGVDADVVDRQRRARCPDGQGGLLVLRKPLPYMLRTVWRDPPATPTTGARSRAATRRGTSPCATRTASSRSSAARTT